MSAIERAAAAYHESLYVGGTKWGDLAATFRHTKRVRMRAALSAALNVDELAGVIAAHRMLPALGGTATGAWVDCSCGERITGWTRDHAQAQADRHLARALKEHLTKGTNDE